MTAASPAPQRALTARERIDLLLIGSDGVKTGWAAHLTDQLMPLVEEIAAERAAEALERRAEEARRWNP